MVTHKDRLLRFRAELVFVCEAKHLEILILNQIPIPYRQICTL